MFVTSTFYDQDGFAYLRALDGATGDEKWGASAGVYSSPTAFSRASRLRAAISTGTASPSSSPAAREEA